MAERFPIIYDFHSFDTNFRLEWLSSPFFRSSALHDLSSLGRTHCTIIVIIIITQWPESHHATHLSDVSLSSWSPFDSGGQTEAIYNLRLYFLFFLFLFIFSLWFMPVLGIYVFVCVCVCDPQCYDLIYLCHLHAHGRKKKPPNELQYELTLVASDSLNENHTKIVINVRDVNDLPPVFPQKHYNYTMDEEIPAPFRFLQVKPTAMHTSFAAFFYNFI